MLLALIQVKVLSSSFETRTLNSSFYDCQDKTLLRHSPVNLRFGQRRNGPFNKSTNLLLSLFFFRNSNVLLLNHVRVVTKALTIMAINMLNTTSVQLECKRFGRHTIAHHEPCNEKYGRNPCDVILSLEHRRCVKNLRPILRAQYLVHPKKRIPDSTKGHFVLVPELVYRWNVSSDQLTRQNRDQECHQ